ncbi:MAG: MFS transporter [Solobacterium sp.]|jgi:nitrate/nitrite transporter NarK|nr:MFS transporter [Solobacterium sp.]MCH4048834.1 MFS transporter [Solobacterium sp.]MCH4074412.1 MFS transporter [Solobacterium sp.]
MQLFKEYRGLSRETYILSLGRLVTAMGSMVWPMMTMILKVKMHIQADTIAALMTAGSLAMIPLTLIGGKMADHLTRRKIIIVCDIISIIGYLYCKRSIICTFKSRKKIVMITVSKDIGYRDDLFIYESPLADQVTRASACPALHHPDR